MLKCRRRLRKSGTSSTAAAAWRRSRGTDPMYDFAYHKPTSIADAVKLLAADPDARPISGGQTLLPALKHRLNKPTALIDLSAIAEMRGVRREGNKIAVGAMTKHADVATNAEVKAAIPALAQLA